MNTMHFGNTTLRRGFAATIVFGLAIVGAGFCLITSTIGDRRVYLNSAIPLTIQLNSSVPSEYVSSIRASMQTWNDLPSSYWQFALGSNTSASSVSQDGINLLFFDLAGVNFPPPTSVIAFSSTFTSSAGSYHAIESDLIWNARDFPPSPVGAPGAQDLQSVVTHELGHHLGLDHTGLPSGATSGCGPQVPAATMWWSSSNGDTTKRSLHLEDVMGVSVLYPSWKIQGNITSNGVPVATFPLWFRGSKASTVGPVENPISSRYNRSGYLLDTLYTDFAGQYSTVAIDQSFDLIVDGFGYERDSVHIAFGAPGPIGQTQTMTQNFQLQQTPMATMTGTVCDAGTQSPIVARIEVYGAGDPAGLSAAVTSQTDGSFSVSLHSKETYRVAVLPPAPYIDKVESTTVYLSLAGATLAFSVPRAEVLLVDDDAGAAFQSSYQNSLDRLHFPRRTFSVADSATSPATTLALFTSRPVIVWETGNDSTNALNATEHNAILSHLAAGGRIILTGQNLAQGLSSNDTLLAGLLGIRYSGPATTVSVKGFVGDVIGSGVNYLVTGGTNPQTSKDAVALVPGNPGVTTPTLYYPAGSDSSQLAGVRVQGGGGWAATFFGFGLEGLSPVRQDTFLLRSFRYFGQVSTGVIPTVGQKIPDRFELEQNFPNPFNPATTIRYRLPQSGKVTLRVFSILGQEVASLVDGHQEAGVHEVYWDGNVTSGASGVYFLQMTAKGDDGVEFVQLRKMILVK
jgi:hypothetical protein